MLHQRVLSRLDAGHVRFHGSTKFHAIVRRSLRKPGYVGTRNQCLGRSAAVVDAGAAKFPALDDAHPPPSRSETLGKGGARLPSAYDDRVVAVHVFLRSEEHTSELQSQSNLVCRLLLEKKNIQIICAMYSVLC